MKAAGRVHFIYNEAQITDTFKKREFILEITDNPQYPQYVKFEFVQDKCDLLNDFAENDMVDIEFNLNGRMHEKDGVVNCFNCNQAWKINKT